jgi:urocanate hydratase
MKRRDFVRRFAAVIAVFLGGRQLIQKAIALNVSIDRMRIKKELGQKYGEKEAEVASQIIKYLKAVKKGKMSKEEAATKGICI